MVLALIAKRRQSEDGQRKWVNFTCVRGGVWYDVKFVHDCAPPAVYDIDKPNNVLRAIIEVDENGSNVAVKNGRNVLFVEHYTALPVDDPQFKAAVEAERLFVNKKREERKAATRSFFAGEAPPQPVDYPDGSENPPPTDDDLPY